MDTRSLLTDTAERMFADHCHKMTLDGAEAGSFPEALLELVKAGGFQQLAMRSSGVDLPDALAVLRAAGRHALPLPLAEMVLGNRWLDDDGALVSAGVGDAHQVGGVPWGRRADAVISVSAHGAAFVLRGFDVEPGTNLAGEPRDRVSGGRSERLAIDEDAFLLLALSRVVLMAGGLERALALSLAYVSEREQFGRPIARFQAIQHHMAVMATQTAAAIRASDAALAGVQSGRLADEVAVGKSRVGEAVGVVVELAHQVHGAMGYTHEHRLHHTTRRLWSWRDEYGAEPYWERRLGMRLAALVAANGADALWSFIATRG